MKKQFSKESNSVARGVLGFLSDAGKSNLLSSVAQVLDEAAEKTRHADEIVITSAVPLIPSEKAALGRTISRFLHNPLPVVNHIDSKLVGGFSIRVGDFFLDASLSADIEGMKHLILT